QRLVPRNVLQTQRDIALYGITRYQIQISEVCNQLQNRTNVDILEVQRQLLSRIGEMLRIALLDIGFAKRLDADSQLVVGLVRQIVVSPARLDRNACAIGLTARIDKLDRR